MALLCSERVTKRFGAHVAVDDVSLEVERGAFYGLLGPSGCGKTTLLRLISGLDFPDSGEIVLEGRLLGTEPPHRRRVSTVFQNYALFPHLTVQDNVEFGMRRQGMGKPVERARQLLELVQLQGKERRFPAQLSGGERQRVALARALAVAPALLLLDEPLAALDPNLRKQVRAELAELHRQSGTTFLLVTHDQDEAMALCGRLSVMRDGKLEQTGSPREVYLRPVNRFVAGFVGSVNWIGDRGVRPEALRITRERPAFDVPVYEGVVERVTFLGPVLQVAARLLTGEGVVADVLREDLRFPGELVPGVERVFVWWRPCDELPAFDAA